MTTEQALSVLGLKANVAVLEDVKPAYRQLAKLLHPDKGGDESKFVELVTAYELLTGRRRVRRIVRNRPMKHGWAQYVYTDISRATSSNTSSSYYCYGV